MNGNYPEGMQNPGSSGGNHPGEASGAYSQPRYRSRTERARQENAAPQKPLVYTEGSLYAPNYTAPVPKPPQPVSPKEQPHTAVPSHLSSVRPDFTAGSPYGTQYGPYISGVPLPNQAPVQAQTQHTVEQQPVPERRAEHKQPQKTARVEPHRKRSSKEAPAQPIHSSGFYPPKQEQTAPAAAGRALLLNRLLMLICAVVFAVSAFLLIRYFANILITRHASAKLEDVYQAAVQSAETEAPSEYPMPTETPAPTAAPVQAASASRPTAVPPAKELWPDKYPGNPMLRVSSVFYELQRQNPDIIGWLKIDGVLEEAVVQRDNEYYLTHNALKQKSVTGALFLDESCDLKKVPTQTLIHGHNMKEGAMFGSLKKYKVKDASFYRAHPYIEFNTIYENSTYVIFAVAEVDLRWNKGDYLPFWEDVRFRSADDFMNYVRKARDLSHYRCNVDVQPGDRLLTLSTCTGSDDNKRLIVMARRLRDDEDKLQLNMSIMTTYDR